MAGIRKKRRAYVEQMDCVACGCCVKVCPKGALAIVQGVRAEVDRALCVGCGLCLNVCPIGAIDKTEEE